MIVCEHRPQVSFRWKNPDFLFKDPDFLLRNPDFLLKNVDFIIKKNSPTGYTNPCNVSPCQNGGTCVASRYSVSYTCSCPSIDIVGFHCEVQMNLMHRSGAASGPFPQFTFTLPLIVDTSWE